MDKQLEVILKKHNILVKGKGIMQNKYHEWDVYNHTMMVVEHVNGKGADNTLVVAAYLHDLGKILNAKPRVKDGKVQHDPSGNPYHVFDEPLRHEQTGADYIAQNISEDYFIQFDVDKDKVVELVKHHFVPMTYIKRMWKSESLEEMGENYQLLLDELGRIPVSKERLLILFYADTLAKSSDNEHQANIIMVYEHLVENKHSLADIYQKQLEMKKQKT